MLSPPHPLPREGEAPVRLLDGGREAYPAMLDAIRAARADVFLEVYAFSPEGVGAAFIAELSACARRGVRVEVVIDAWGSAPGTSAGVEIAEWTCSVLHAKAAVVDGERLLVGSFNLDPFSLANLEVLAEVEDAEVAAAGERWIRGHFAGGERIALETLGRRTLLERLAVEHLGPLVARIADRIRRFILRP